MMPIIIEIKLIIHVVYPYFWKKTYALAKSSCVFPFLKEIEKA